MSNRTFCVAALRVQIGCLLTELTLFWSTAACRHQLKNFCSSLPINTGRQTDDCFVMRPQAASRGRRINTSVVVTVPSAFSALMLLVGRLEEHSACKN